MNAATMTRIRKTTTATAMKILVPLSFFLAKPLLALSKATILVEVSWPSLTPWGMTMV